MSALRCSDAIWPRSSDFVDCSVPRLSLGQELAIVRSTLSDLRSAESIAKTIAWAEFTECPPPESGLFLADDEIEYFDEREVSDDV